MPGGSGAIEVTAPTSPSAGFLITTNDTDTVVITGNLADVNDTRVTQPRMIGRAQTVIQA